MMIRKWNDLPAAMRSEAVRPYYDALCGKKASLLLKRVFDLALSAVLLLILSPVFLLAAAVIKLDSPGPVFFRQARITAYGKQFRIFKFRTMVRDAPQRGPAVTVAHDPRITRAGKYLRRFHLDEMCQLIDVFRGVMSFVGVRPEVPKYVAAYTPEMRATLLLPAGITSRASLLFREEAALLNGAENAEQVYLEKILPAKMKYNLDDLLAFSLRRDIRVLFQTLHAVFFK